MNAITPLQIAPATFSTREAWLQAAVETFRPAFEAEGSPLPQIRVAIGFTAGGVRGKSIGECWAPQASTDGRHTIHIRPEVIEPARLLDILLHECVHAALPWGSGHGPAFRKLATALGLTGPMTSTVASPELKLRLEKLAESLGPLPHARLLSGFAGTTKAPAGPKDEPKEAPEDRPAGAPPKQSTRLLKAACPACGYTVRLTRKWAEVGAPICPTHREPMVVEGL